MVLQAKQLVAVGHSVYAGSKQQLRFMTALIESLATCPNDEWEFRLSCRLKTLGVAKKAILRHPWEVALYPDGIPGAEYDGELPAKALQKIEAGRESCRDFLGTNADQMSFADVKKIVNLRAAVLKKQDRSFECDITFFKRPRRDNFDAAV